MKRILIQILPLFFVFTGCAQIKNHDFEQSKADAATLPADWSVFRVVGYATALDQSEKHSGNASFKISNADSTVRGYQTFSQVVPIEVESLKKISVTVYIKTKAVKGEVATWCQLWDKNDKQIGFQNLAMQRARVPATSEWTKYTLNLVVDKAIKKLFFGAYLAGTGSVWFDDFKLEDVPVEDVAPAADAAKYVADFAAIVKKNSIYKDSLDWAAIDAGTTMLSKGIKSIDDAKNVINYILGKLHQAGDNHSFIQPPSVAKAYATENTNPRRTTSKLIANNIGYISVPGFGSVNQQVMDDFAKEIQQKISTIDTENDIVGWVVDLRTNGGGNMHPMIAGLGPLLGDGTLGYFVSGNGKQWTPWSYSIKKKKPGAPLGVNIEKPYQLRKPDSKIAVLVGGGTGSSGEMTALSFIGKPNTKLFGQSTGGYTSGNQQYPLSDGSMLLLAVSYTADRNKKEYRSKIQPDVTVKEVQGDDATLKSAQNWLQEK